MAAGLAASPLSRRLEALLQAVALIRRTRNRDEQRVMLGYLLADLRSLDHLSVEALPAREAALLSDLKKQAQALRKEVGRPINPDDDPLAPRKEPRHGSSTRRRAGPVRVAGSDPGREPAGGAAPAREVPGVRGQDQVGTAASGGPGGVRRSAGPGFRKGVAGLSPGGLDDASAVREDRGAGRELSYVDWLRLGFNSAVAYSLEQRKASPGALGRLSRKEISKIPGFGSKSVQLIERLLGHPLPPDKPPPRLAYWLDRGIPIQGARALVNAGIETVEDLAGRSRDELRSIRFVGEVVISRLEEAVGTSFPDRSAYWLAKGLTPRLSNALVRLGLFREEDLRALTREQFLAMPGVAESGLRCCEAVLGQPLRGGR